MITLAVDCMGGDHGPRVTLAACRTFLDQHADARLLLVGLPHALEGFVHERATLVPASEVVNMDDAVEVALRRKKDSSMRVAIQQVKEGKAAAAVSAVRHLHARLGQILAHHLRQAGVVFNHQQLGVHGLCSGKW